MVILTWQCVLMNLASNGNESNMCEINACDSISINVY